jgi:aquaporin Z
MGEGEIKIEENKEVSLNVSGIAARKYVAELLGTFVLVFMGCGSAVFYALFSGPFGIPSSFGLLGISFAFGLSVLVMVYAIGGISGCHINPAITISMLVAGKINAKDAAAYIGFQFIGAILGAGAVYSIASGNANYSLSTVGLGQNGYDIASPAGFSLASCFVAEVLLTFIFLLVIHGSTSEKAPKGFAGLSIGLSLVLIHIVGIPITGTSVNPARSLGPALIMGIANTTALSQLWLFIVAPIIGGILAALVWQFIEK